MYAEKVKRFSVFLSLLCVAGCGDHVRPRLDDPGRGIPGSGAAGSGSSGAGGGGPSSNGCSADLTQTLDVNGVVLQTCAPDEGCADRKCVPACEAAAASHGNVGCDFVLSTPHFYPTIAPPCFAAFVTNSWAVPAQITVTRGNATFDVTKFGRIASSDPDPAHWDAVPSAGLPPGQVAVLFLSDDPASFNATPLICPVTPAVHATNGTAIWPGDGSNGTARGVAFHVTTSVPVSTYDMLPFGGAASLLPSAELVFPTTAWGTNYVAVLPPPSSGPAWGQIIASEDGTTVNVLPDVDLPGGSDFPASGAHSKAVFKPDAGEYIQWQGPDMTGSILQSDKPIAFMGGDAYECYKSLTSGPGGCDSGHQLVPPVRALGSDYVAPPYKSRGGTESVPYMVVGAVDGTTLTYDPPVTGAPTKLGKGQSVLFESTSPFHVNAQDDAHPFYMGEEMPGKGGVGDEEFVNLMPPGQWLSRYVFYTDYSYPTTNLVVVRVKGANGFEDVTVDCESAPLGQWTSVGTDGRYEMTNLDLVRDGVNNGACGNGPHTAKSTSPFGLMVWGLSNYASYAYPAGGNATPLNQVIITPN